MIPQYSVYDLYIKPYNVLSKKSFDFELVKENILSIISVPGSSPNLVLNLHICSSSTKMNASSNLKLNDLDRTLITNDCDYINNILNRFNYMDLGTVSMEGFKNKRDYDPVRNAYCLSDLYNISRKLTEILNSGSDNYLVSPDQYKMTYEGLFNKAISASHYKTLVVTADSFKIPKKGFFNITVPNPLFLNFTDTEQQKYFNVYLPKNPSSTLTNTNTPLQS